MWKNKVMPAFTLLEAAVVLALVSILVGFSFTFSAQTETKATEQKFFQALATTWQKHYQASLGDKEGFTVNFQKHQVSFSSPEPTVLTYPKSLYLKHNQQIVVHKTLSSVDPKTIQLFSNKQAKEYDLVFQLGYGGKYYVKEKAI